MNKEVDIADLIAGELLCSRADAYDLMRNALSKVEQEPVTDEENEQFSEDVSNFKGADPEATKFALEQFLKRRGMHPFTTPQAQPMKQSLTVIPVLQDYLDQELRKERTGHWALYSNGERVRYLDIYEFLFIESTIKAANQAKGD